MSIAKRFQVFHKVHFEVLWCAINSMSWHLCCPLSLHLVLLSPSKFNPIYRRLHHCPQGAVIPVFSIVHVLTEWNFYTCSKLDTETKARNFTDGRPVKQDRCRALPRNHKTGSAPCNTAHTAVSTGLPQQLVQQSKKTSKTEVAHKFSGIVHQDGANSGKIDQNLITQHRVREQGHCA